MIPLFINNIKKVKKMDYRKLVLYIALVVVALTLWNMWQREHVSPSPQTNNEMSVPATVPTMSPQSNPVAGGNSVPSLPSQAQSNTVLPSLASNNAAQMIKVKTDVLDLTLDKKGGTLIRSVLFAYPVGPKQAESLVLLNNDPQSLYLIQGGLIGPQGPDTSQGPVTYTTSSNQYTLAPDAKTLNVDLQWTNSKGFSVIKRYIFTRGQYDIKVQYILQNNSLDNWTVYPYAQLQRKEPPKESGLTHYGLFTGAAISSPDKHYQKLSFDDLKDAALNQNITGGWAAMIQHYFLSAWVPPQNSNYHYYSSRAADNVYTVGMMGPALVVAPHQNQSTELTLYSGPAIAKNLDQVAPHLNLTIDYGWLWFISAALFWVMTWIHKLIGNWGWSIVILTLLIKLCFYHLSAKSYTSMAHMRRLQPKMQQLKERFADDKQKLSQAIMEMYRSEKVNPLSGCLPIVIQIPFFIALYYMIIESVELRQAPFMLWIHDLSVADPFYILPVIMGGLMFLQQKLNPPAPDPMQQKIMMFLPVIFTVFFLSFPAGLVLYWITNTALSILQQWYILKKVNKAV
jgi:YidC/Oxa1 family membrane protein insertase